MPQSPIKETEDPLIGASSIDATSKPTQLTDAQQRGGASGPGTPGLDSAGPDASAIKAAAASAEAVAGEAGGKSRKDIETGQAQS